MDQSLYEVKVVTETGMLLDLCYIEQVGKFEALEEYMKYEHKRPWTLLPQGFEFMYEINELK